MNKKVFQLDEILTESGFIELAISEGIIIKKELKNLSNILKEYKDVLEEQKEYELHKGERILENFIPYSNGDYYNLIWSVDKAEVIIKKYNIMINKLDLSEIYTSVSEKKINKSHLNFASKNINPIIVGQFEPSGKAVIIDGNHRVYSKYQNGDTEILAYLLSPKYQIQVMVGEIFKNLYKINSNLRYILEYVAGYSTEKELKNSLYKIKNKSKINYMI